MAAPKGNKNAIGNKGGGRKSAYQENADALMLHEMFFNPMSRGAVQAKIKSGEYSLKDAFVAKGYAGNEHVLLALFHKCFPDDLRAMEQRNMLGDGAVVEAMRSVDDATAFIEATINGVRSGSISAQTAADTLAPLREQLEAFARRILPAPPVADAEDDAHDS